jgi:hypothetical protein
MTIERMKSLLQAPLKCRLSLVGPGPRARGERAVAVLNRKGEALGAGSVVVEEKGLRSRNPASYGFRNPAR